MSIHSELSPEAEEPLRKQKTASTVVSIIVSLLSVLLLGVILALLVKFIPSESAPDPIFSQNYRQEEPVILTDPPLNRDPRKTVKAPSSTSSTATSVLISTAPTAINIPTSTLLTEIGSTEFGESPGFGAGTGFSEGVGGGSFFKT